MRSTRCCRCMDTRARRPSLDSRTGRLEIDRPDPLAPLALTPLWGPIHLQVDEAYASCEPNLDGRSTFMSVASGVPHPSGVGLGPGRQAASLESLHGGHDLAKPFPGPPDWHLAPLSMAWEGLSDGALCRVIKDPRHN